MQSEFSKITILVHGVAICCLWGRHFGHRLADEQDHMVELVSERGWSEISAPAIATNIAWLKATKGDVISLVDQLAIIT
jgi:hypothetical protein